MERETPKNSSARFLVRLRSIVGVWAMTVLAGCQSPMGPNSEGVRFFQLGQYDAAANQFRMAIQRDPQNADAYYNLASVYHRAGVEQNDQNLLTQAESLYNDSLDRNPANPDTYRGLAVLLTETNRPQQAFTLLNRWSNDTRQPPQSLANARVELARLYEEFGDKPNAERSLQQALQYDQRNARAWAAVARIREAEGDLSQALANYERSLQLDQRQTAVAERVASLQRSVGRPVTPYTPPQSPGTRVVNSTGPMRRY